MATYESAGGPCCFKDDGGLEVVIQCKGVFKADPARRPHNGDRNAGGGAGDAVDRGQSEQF
jgi:hypothetical protein